MSKVIFPILIILICLGTILPFFHVGFFEFHDNTQIVRVFEMYKSLGDKMFPVRLVGWLGYGYGYPIFNFYSPLPYYLGAVFAFMGFDFVNSTKSMMSFGTLLSGLTMFYLAKKYFGSTAGIVASVIYAYFPYHAVNIYVRGAVGELFAYAFLPLVFLGMLELLSIKFRKNLFFHEINTVLLISFGIFLVAISHNLSLLMLFLLLPIFLVFGLLKSSSKKAFLLLFFCSLIFILLISKPNSSFHFLTFVRTDSMALYLISF